MEDQRIEYRYGIQFGLSQMVDLYRASTLGERRPIDDINIMQAMLDNSNLIVTAWEGDLLVGISRSLTDFQYVAYLSDLAVRVSHQHMGIGRALIKLTRAKLGNKAQIVLLSAPAATEYYPKIGFKSHPRAFILGPKDELL